MSHRKAGSGASSLAEYLSSLRQTTAGNETNTGARHFYARRAFRLLHIIRGRDVASLGWLPDVYRSRSVCGSVRSELSSLLKPRVPMLCLRTTHARLSRRVQRPRTRAYVGSLSPSSIGAERSQQTRTYTPPATFPTAEMIPTAAMNQASTPVYRRNAIYALCGVD